MALIMNGRDIEKVMATQMLEVMLNKLDNAEPHQLYQICAALAAERIDPALISSDWYYGLYLKVMASLEQLDMNQLQMIVTFLTSPSAESHVPQEFFEVTLTQQMIERLAEFEKHADELDAAPFLRDYISALVPLAIKQAGSDLLYGKVVAFAHKHLDTLSPPNLEKLLLFLRQGPPEVADLVSACLDRIEGEGMIAQGQV